MTIALGVLAGDGLIIAADSEESDGILKTHQHKIAVSVNMQMTATWDRPGKKRKSVKPAKPVQPRAVCAIAGSGDAAYLDTLTPLLACGFGKTQNVDECQHSFGKTIGAFYRENVIPFAKYPANDRPDFSTIIGVTTETENALFASEKTALRRCAPYQAVGVGATFATLLLKRLWPQAWVDRKTAALIVSYIMFLVKESVENCGKLTDVVVLHNGTRSYMPWQISRELETIFLRYWRFEGDAIHSLFSMSQPHQAQSVKSVDDLFAAFRGELTTLAKKLSFEDAPKQ